MQTGSDPRNVVYLSAHYMFFYGESGEKLWWNPMRFKWFQEYKNCNMQDIIRSGTSIKLANTKRTKWWTETNNPDTQ
jgi:hypothetical protein